MRRNVTFLLLLIGALLLAACGQSLPTAEEIVDQMEAARASTNSAHAVVDIAFTSPEESGSIQVEGWMEKIETAPDEKPIVRVRAEVLDASQADLVGTLVVSDGEQFWLYNPGANTAVTGSADEMKDRAPSEPTGATQMLQDVVQQGLDAVNLEVLGEEQVAGKNTWKVKVTPKAETSEQLKLDGIIEGTMWVDTELALPLKLSLDASDFGSGTFEVRSIETNIDLGDDLFSFTPPEGAEVVQAADLAAQMQPKATTLDEARTSVSFVLREPGYLPAGMALVEARTVGTGTVILNYAADGASLSVVQSNEDVGGDREPPAGSSVSEVTVGDSPATLISGGDGQGSLLRWEEDGIKYVVAGTISADEALKVAEGLK